MITIDTDSSTPLTDQVADGLRYAIASGALRSGDPLPAVRQLAADLEVHFNTIARAYRALEAEGLVHSARGRGSRVAADRSGAPGSRHAAVRAALRDTLARARLDGLDRRRIEHLINDELGRLWPPHAPHSSVEPEA